MENVSPMDVLPEDIGLPIQTKEIGKYIFQSKKEKCGKYRFNQKFLSNTDESGSRIVWVRTEDTETKEYHFTYNASTELDAVLYEYQPNYYGKDMGAVIVGDYNEEIFLLAAEIDFYNAIDKINLPVCALMKIYAMALDIKIFNDTKEFNNVVNKEPIAATPEGKPVKMGHVFFTPIGIMPGNEKTAFPALSYLHSVVKKVESKTHSFTRKEFFVLTCEGVMGDFELLCSPKFINENVKEGSVVKGYVLFRIDIQ